MNGAKSGNDATYAKTPGVDLKSFFHVFRDTHKLAQDYRALLRHLLRNHELH